MRFLTNLLPLAALIAFTPAGYGSSTTGAVNGHEPGEDSVFTRAPYIQLATTNSIFVAWRNEHAINPIVRYGANPDSLDRQTAATDIITKVSFGTNKVEHLPAHLNKPDILKLSRLHSAPFGYFQYEAKLTGLLPDTKYFYAIYDGDRRLTERDESYHFVTLPPIGISRKARFWIVGDGGTAREQQHSVYGAMLGVVDEERRPLDFYLHLGDMAYTRGKDNEFQTRFFEMYEPTLRHLVCWATMGNHEGATSKGSTGIGPYYDAYICPTRGEAGGVPSGTEAYYSWDYGRIHLICLNSHDLDRKPTGAMAMWLKADLERTKADWLVAYFHHPPYTKGTHDSDKEKQLIEMRTHIMPILESGGVDLVLTGHSHIYERSMLIDGAYATPTVAENVVLDDGDGDPKGDGPYKKSKGINPNEGAVQIVAGHGGTTLGRKGTIPFMKSVWVEHGSVIIDVDGDTLTGRMFNKFGELRDTFGMVKGGQVSLARMVNPRLPQPWKKIKLPGDKEPPPEPPEDYYVVVPHHAEWQYLVDAHPKTNSWMKIGFNGDGWKTGEAGIGYTYKDARTVLADMRSNYTVVYMRHEFEIEQADSVTEIGLMMNYDDGFIAYLNGKEVARKGVGKGAGRDAKDIKSHDAGRFEYILLKDFEKYLKDGKNCIAIEGHNSSLTSSDFLMDPYLILED